MIIDRARVAGGRECFQHSVELRRIGLHRTKKCNGIAALDEKCRKIFNIKIPHQIGLVFDVYPDEGFIRMPRCQSIEVRPISRAYVAPLCTQARDNPCLGLQYIGELFLMVKIERK